jgi:curved DNA-binding protein CbpA
MVKADASRNYYADLKVTPNASENEIRKAFRSLALQYHPDRNPGREQEFVVKFQEIQAAHEVLCDPTQRLKYDKERTKYRNLNIPTNTPNTPRARPPPPPRNAYTTTTPSGSYYRPPPPKPQPQPQRPPPPQHHQTYNSGQDRFTNKNFRPPPTAQRPHSSHKDTQDRANVFTAWQKMKSGARPEEPRPHNPTNPNNPNGTPFGRSQSTRVPSNKTGFNPGTPGADEGPAKSGGYRSSYARPAATPPTPAESSSPNVDAPFSEGNRVRTPYYSKAAGLREEGIGRSASMRNSPSHSHQPSPSHEGGSYSDSGHRQQRNSYGGHPTKGQFPQMYPDSSDESEAEVFQKGTARAAESFEGSTTSYLEPERI